MNNTDESTVGRVVHIVEHHLLIQQADALHPKHR